MMKKIICLLITLTLSLAVSPVLASEAASEENDIDYTTGTPWLYSNLDGNVTADTEAPDIVDDFYLACNIEALQNMQIPEGYNRYGTQAAVNKQLNDDIVNLFTSNAEAESQSDLLCAEEDRGAYHA